MLLVKFFFTSVKIIYLYHLYRWYDDELSRRFEIENSVSMNEMNEIQKYIQDIRYEKMNIFQRENSFSWKWLYDKSMSIYRFNFDKRYHTDDMIFDLQITV